MDKLRVSVVWFELERKVDKEVLGREETETAWGWVQQIDMNQKQIKLVNDVGFWWIYLIRLMRIERV